MAKRIIFFVVLGLFVSSLGYPCSRNELTEAERRELLIETYRRHIGVRELTGNNDGEAVESFLKASGLGKGFAWCAAFATYCHLENELPYPAKASAWSPSWFVKDRLIEHSKAKAGDVFGIYYTKLKRIGHVGFIDEDWGSDSDKILTVEGNTNGDGSREGDGVYRKRRSKKQIKQVSRWN